MLPRRTITKRQKKEALKHRYGIVFVFLGLLIIAVCLFFLAFFDKPEPLINPLSKNQTSSTKKLADVLKKKNVSYVSITTQNDLNYKITLDNKGEVIINPNKDLDAQVSSLQLILSQLKIDGKAFKRLDFRYEKPIITF